jgi:4-amino-4-deoxy-L-arabinose transferase-like glycosyltransferase
MVNYSTSNPSTDQLLGDNHPFSYLEWLPPLFLIALVLVFIPIGSIFEYNFDEGFELMRAFLQNQGLLLYKDIWSDQPPVLSQLLRAWLGIFGNSIFYARLLVLIFAANLLYFFYKTLALFFDKVTALFASLLLIFTEYFIPFSAQVKVDMPALSLGMTSIFYFLNGFYHRNPKTRIFSLIVSGILLALAIETKLYVILLVFVLVAYSIVIYLQNFKDKETKNWIVKAFLSWGISLALFGLITMLGFYLWLGDSLFELLIGSHLQADEYFNLNLSTLIQSSFRQDTSFWILTAAGLLFWLTKERWRILFPTLWLIVTVAIFYNHSPIWPHYYLLLAMPMSWIGSSVFFWCKQQIKSPNFGNFRHLTRNEKTERLPSIVVKVLTLLGMALIGFVLFSLVLLNIKVIVQKNHPFQKIWGEEIKAEILANVKNYGEQTNWIATDRGMFAFYANQKVPPELAVLSRKRVVSQGFDGSDFLEVIQKYKPEQVLIGRFVEGRFDKPFLNDVALFNYLGENYQDITIENQKEGQIIHHYVLNSLKN